MKSTVEKSGAPSGHGATEQRYSYDGLLGLSAHLGLLYKGRVFTEAELPQETFALWRANGVLTPIVGVPTTDEGT